MLTRKVANKWRVGFHVFSPLNRMLTSTTTDWDFVFADDEREANPTSFKFLQMAHAWKSAQKNAGGGGGGSSSSVLSGFMRPTSSAPTNGEKDAEASSGEERSDGEED